MNRERPFIFLEKCLADLGDGKRPLVSSKLAHLSDLIPEELRRFKEAWMSIGVERRRQVISRLAELAEDNFELDFDSVFRASLRDPDEAVRVKAVEGLAHCEDCSLIDSLISLVEGDPAEAVRVAAVMALGRFALLAELQKLHPHHVARLQKALFAVIEAEGEHSELRRRAIEAIAPMSLPRVREAIEKAYRSNSPKLQASAIYAMGRNCHPIWLPVLLRELGNPDPEIRYEAARACGEMGEEEAVPYLAPLIRDVDVQVQLAAIVALGQIGGREAKVVLRQSLESDDSRIRQAAEEAWEEAEFAADPFSFGV